MVAPLHNELNQGPIEYQWTGANLGRPGVLLPTLGRKYKITVRNDQDKSGPPIQDRGYTDKAHEAKNASSNSSCMVVRWQR